MKWFICLCVLFGGLSLAVAQECVDGVCVFSAPTASPFRVFMDYETHYVGKTATPAPPVTTSESCDSCQVVAAPPAMVTTERTFTRRVIRSRAAGCFGSRWQQMRENRRQRWESRRIKVRGCH